MPFQHLRDYAAAIRNDLRANPADGGEGADVEPMLHDRFRTLVEDLLPVLFPGHYDLPNVSVEWRREGVGRPDVAFSRRGSARSFVELKRPDKSIVPRNLRGRDKTQFDRYSNLPLWALSNFHAITLYERGEALGTATIVPPETLEPDTADAAADLAIEAHDATPFLRMIETLALAEIEPPRNAQEMATTLAYAARFVKGVAADLAARLPPHTDDEDEEERRCNDDYFYAVREEFRQVLYERPQALGHDEDADFNDLFAIAFAQTLAYGLLLAREEAHLQEARRAEDEQPQQGRVAALIDYNAHEQISPEAHPLLRATLRALLQEEVRDILGPALSVLLETVNATNPELLEPQRGRDPILYFYEDFLRIFDESLWRRYGVIYTPVEVVRYQIAATQRALEALNTDGLLDVNVRLLDPACGTGTYLIAAAEAAGRQAQERYGGAAVRGEVRSLIHRLFGLEIMVGPYAVAHYRLMRTLRALGAAPEGDRLNIFLADTLAPVEMEHEVHNVLGFMGRPLVEERLAADEVKSQTPVLAIFGNPPYRRLEVGETHSLVGDWVSNRLWERYKEPVRAAGWGNQLNTFPDLYIAFFAWAQWKLFWRDNAERRGVLSFITNRSYLTGKPYAGLRQMLRRDFDRIEILDLRGDSRVARPAGIEHDENVFDIQAGVAIVTAYATNEGNREAPAEVYYADAYALQAYTRAEKFALLNRVAEDPTAHQFVRVERDWLDDFRPTPFEGRGWLSLSDLFLENKTGSKTQRDPLVVGIRSEDVQRNIRGYLNSRSVEQRYSRFLPTNDDPSDRLRGTEARAFVTNFDATRIGRYSYRPFDLRFVYMARDFVQEPCELVPHCWTVWQLS